MIVRALRSWIGSVVACVVLLAAWITMQAISTGRMQYLLHTLFDVSVAFGAIFAAVAAVLYVPAFAILQAVAGPRLRPALAVSAGVLLAPAAALAFTMAFREAESPQTVSAQLGYWASHAPQVFMGMWPVLVAGGVFGLLWSRQPARDRRLARA